MQEQQVRRRVMRFLHVRVKGMAMPAALGLGLTIGACGEGEIHPPYGTPFPYPRDAAQSQPDASDTNSLDAGLPDVSALDAGDGPGDIMPPDASQEMATPLDAAPSLDSGDVDVDDIH